MCSGCKGEIKVQPYKEIEVSHHASHAGVWQVYLKREAVRNAFNDALIAELTHAFKAIAADDAARAVVLGGHGKAFCAGADLGWMRQMADYTWEENRSDAQALADMLWAIYSCPVPVIARIQGDCYAGGVGLAAACDIRVAVEGAHFCLSEVKLGLIPATISPYVIRAMNPNTAMRYFITAERFNASAAQAMGLVQTVCATDELDAHITHFLSAILGNAPQAVRACKALVHEVGGQPITADLRAHTARQIADIRSSEEGKIGVQAFLSKVTPPWQTTRT